MKNFNRKATSYTSFSNTSHDEGLRRYFLNIYQLMSAGLAITAISVYAFFSVQALTNLMFNITPDGYLAGMTAIGWLVTFVPIGIIYISTSGSIESMRRMLSCYFGYILDRWECL